ncbi:MAG: hypothetical protein GEV11_21055 [Streptosporangiales bacterium]|nr:hypothetical protein [Streptosporangiales bacterium]
MVDHALVELEHAGWDALSRGQEAVFYGEIMLDDGVMVFPIGILGKRDALNGLAGVNARAGAAGPPPRRA